MENTETDVFIAKKELEQSINDFSDAQKQLVEDITNQINRTMEVSEKLVANALRVSSMIKS